MGRPPTATGASILSLSFDISVRRCACISKKIDIQCVEMRPTSKKLCEQLQPEHHKFSSRRCCHVTLWHRLLWGEQKSCCMYGPARHDVSGVASAVTTPLMSSCCQASQTHFVWRATIATTLHTPTCSAGPHSSKCASLTTWLHCSQNLKGAAIIDSCLTAVHVAWVPQHKGKSPT